MMLRRPSWLVLARDRPETAVGLANAAVMVGGGVLLAFVVGWWALAVVGTCGVRVSRSEGSAVHERFL